MPRNPSPQTWLNHKFPSREQKEKVKILFISSQENEITWLSTLTTVEITSPNTFSFTEQNLTGDLDLSELVNLEKVWIKNQFLNRIEISGCQKLKSFDFNNNSGWEMPKVINVPPPMNDFGPLGGRFGRSPQTKSKPTTKPTITQEKVREYLATKTLPTNLTKWEDFCNLFPTEEEDDNLLLTRILELEGKEVYEYFEVFFGFVFPNSLTWGLNFSSNELDYLEKTVGRILELKKGLEPLKEQNYLLSTQLKQCSDELSTIRKNLDASKSELTKKEGEVKELKEKLTNLEENNKEKELVSQLEQKEQELTKLRNETNKSTASLRKDIDSLKKQLVELEQQKEKENKELTKQLAGLLVSSELLSKQVEELTKDRDKEKLEKERIRLESEVRSNLLREKDNKLSQQEQQIKHYEGLLRKAEENLTQAQKIIQQKSDLLENLEKEKNLIAEELELANDRIKELEQGEILYQQKISELEKRIRELEKQGNSKEIERAKKELEAEKKKNQQEKNKFQQEINRLKSELAQTKKREEELAEKVKELSKRRVRVQEISEQKSFWQTIKTPLFYTGGIILVIITLGWLYSKFKE